MVDIAKAVRFSRLKLGLSQSQLAAEAGVGLATIQNIEANRANPAFKTLTEIFKILKIRMVLEVSPVKADWALLGALGCPITVAKNVEQAPSLELLIEQVRRLDVTTLRNRESVSISAWLHAIRDHFPSTWRSLNYATRAWAQNQKIRPKLRRIAVERLAEFL